ncbi:MAG TPA: S8 family serine peptidase [Mycobacteriales bacterium]|nr:S8 family serine peptidase [Mycobacteriales bacterium]
MVSLKSDSRLSAPGVQVLAHYDAARVAVVRGTPRALAALARDRQVRSMSPDLPVRVTGAETAAGTGQLASEAIGGTAGQPGAGAGVTVAVVDTGITDTAYLNRASGRLIDGFDNSGGDAKKGVDGYGHGTSMANLIAGGSANGGPAVGIAPAARVLNVKVAGADGTTSLSKVVDGLNFVIKSRPTYGTKALSISLSTTVEGGDYIATPLTDAVDRVREAGVVVLAAVGNTGGKVGSPAYDPGIIAVGAADTTRPKVTVPDFSAAAVVEGVPRPDFVAPGVGVRSVLPAGSQLARDHAVSQGPDGFWRGTGTSQATAVAAGTAAIFLGNFPAATVHETRFSLMSASRPLDGTRAGAGVLRVPRRVFTPDQFKAGLRQINDAGDTAIVDSWSGSSWSGSSWSGSSWSGSSWSGSSWSGSSWSGSSWSGSSWSGSSWSGSSWSGSSWSGSSWSAAVWAAGSWSLTL